MALMVVWCARVLHIGTAGWRFGLAFSCWSVGGLVAAAALPRLLRRAGTARITRGAMPFSAVLGVLTALTRWWPLAGGALGEFLGPRVAMTVTASLAFPAVAVAWSSSLRRHAHEPSPAAGSG